MKPEQLVPKVQQDLLARQVVRVRLEQPVLPVQLELPAMSAQQVPQEIPEPQVQRDQLVTLALRGRLAHKEFKD